MNKKEILEEIKNVLQEEKNKESNCVFLYEVLIVLKKLDNLYSSVEKSCENKFNNIVKDKLSPNSLVVFHGFDYEKKLLHISFKKYRSSDWDDMYFAKENSDLYVYETDSCWANEVFYVLNSSLSESYDELLKYADYNDYQYIERNTKPFNSNFRVKISNCGVWVYDKEYLSKLELFAPSYKDSYEIDCNSNIVAEAITGKETEILKRIFVKIDDCPKWCQAILYEIREKQLEEERKIEEKNKRKEMRKQKVLKIFPF